MTDRVSNQVYFTARFSSRGGMSDMLTVYGNLRKFGLSLGYTYCHTRLVSTRPIVKVPSPLKRKLFESCARNSWEGKGKSSKYKATFKTFVSFTLQNVYDFLGLNQYFTADKTLPRERNFPKNLRYKLPISAQLIAINNISSYEELANYVRNFVSLVKMPDQPLFLVLSASNPTSESSLQKIFDSIPDSTDPIDFRTIYLQRRKKHTQKSGFRKERLKILVHMRLGDRAAIKTPWRTWLHYTRSGLWEQKLDEHNFWQLTATDFYRFTQGLLKQFPRELIDTQIFSDGFDRTLRNMLKMRDHAQLNPLEYKLMEKSLKHQNRQLVPLFENIPEATCFFGETPNMLLKLCDATINADLVISAFPMQENLTHCLLRFYRNRGTMPVWLLLRKQLLPDKEISSQEHAWCLSKVKSLHQAFPAGIPGISFVDIDAPDFPALAQRIMNHWNSNKPR